MVHIMIITVAILSRNLQCKLTYSEHGFTEIGSADSIARLFIKHIVARECSSIRIVHTEVYHFQFNLA